jgi:NADH-quinone oxidoreductase subunit G
LTLAFEGLQKIKASEGSESIGALASPTSTLEELYLLQKLMRGIGSENIDHRLHQVDFSDQNDAPLFPYLGQAIADLESCDATLVIGSHIRKEQPLLNHRLRKSTLRGGKVMLLNSIDYEFNFPIAEKIITAPATWIEELAGIAKALLNKQASLIPQEMEKLLANISISEQQNTVAELLSSGNTATVLLGNLATAHPQLSIIRALAATIAKLSGATFGYMGEANNTSGAWLAGVLPHRRAAGEIIDTAVEKIGLNAEAMLSQSMKAYILLGLEPELDSTLGTKALKSLEDADFVVSFSAFRTPAIDTYADVILPIALFPETSGTYVNSEGKWQSFSGAITPPGDARPAWKILRVLGNLFDVGGFYYTASDEVRDELREKISDNMPNNDTAWQIPSSLTFNTVKGLQRFTEMPIYSVDALVRRAGALQNTMDAKIAAGVHINPNIAAKMGLNETNQVQVKQDETQITLPVVIDDRVPNEGVLIYAGQAASMDLTAWHGEVELSAVN